MPSAPRAGLGTLRVSRGLTAAANHHTRQMGQLGFFEHESVNGAPFWRRIQRFYPGPPRLLVGGREHLLGVTRHEGFDRRPRVDAQPTASGRTSSTGEWREIGVSAEHFDSSTGCTSAAVRSTIVTD